MTRIVVGFAGPIGSGKDTMAKAMAEIFNGTVLKFAHPLYAMAAHIDPAIHPDMTHKEKEDYLLGLEHLGTRRNFLQKLGTEFGRNIIHEKLWVDLQRHKVESTGGAVFYSDVRFNDEAQLIRDLGGHIIHIRCNWIPPTSQQALSHPSEKAVTFVSGDTILGLSEGKIAKGAREVAAVIKEVFHLPTVSALG